MKVIEPTYEIVRPSSYSEGVEMLRFIEEMARISHRSEDKQTEETWGRFIKAIVVDHGDWSVVEHAVATVIFRVDRGVTHELVRHRLFSYTQESTRFVNYMKKGGELEFICPEGVETSGYPVWTVAMKQAERNYLEMLNDGFPPQAARSVLPNALASTIAVTGNLRNWRHLFIMRTTKETHPDFKRVMIPLLKDFKERIPILFDDIEPNLKQSESMAKVR